MDKLEEKAVEALRGMASAWIRLADMAEKEYELHLRSVTAQESLAESTKWTAAQIDAFTRDGSPQ